MNVSLTPELERFVKEQVDAGRYQTASEVVRDGLRILFERQQAIESLNRKIERGLADVAAGRTHSPEEARAILRARRKARAPSAT
jgi:antitoxin ParD1/3/4